MAVPGQVLSMAGDAGLRLAVVDVVGEQREVDVGLLDDEPRPGDWVLVHIGFAIAAVDEAEARQTLQLVNALQEPLGQMPLEQLP